MVTASVSELKARLSHYLRVVRTGGEVQVLDRGRPVARLVAVEADAGARERLAASGSIRLGDPAARATFDHVPLQVGVDIGGALTDDRSDRL